MITDKKIVVIGSGVSGVGAVKLLEAAGAVPTLYDSNEKLTEAEVRKRLPEGSKCKVVLGEFPENLKKETNGVNVGIVDKLLCICIPFAYFMSLCV